MKSWLGKLTVASTCLTVLVAGFVPGLLLPQAANAATFTVACAVGGPGLVSAINSANAAAGPDTVTLAAGCTFTLTSPDGSGNGLPFITSPITIVGNGATIARSSATDFRLIDVLVGGDLTLDHVTLTGGLTPDGSGPSGPGDGGAILNAGTLTVTSSTITGNATGSGDSSGGGFGGPPAGPQTNGGNGGGIDSSGTLTVTGSTISNNTTGAGGVSGAFGGAGGDGGGIYNFGNADISTTTISGNATGSGGTVLNNGQLGGFGGGIANVGTLSINTSTISDNSTGTGGSSTVFGGEGGAGGGIANGDGVGGNGGDSGSAGGPLTVATSAISNNTTGSGGAFTGPLSGGIAGAGGKGGGIYVGGGPTTATNSTVAANATGPGGAGGSGVAGTGGDGGGIYYNSGGLTVTNATIAGNGTGGPGGSGVGGGAGSGGGVHDASTATFTNSIVANNSSLADGNCSGTFTDGGHDLFFPASDTGCPGTAGDPMLGSLANNGGPTKTMALGATSAAIDKIATSGESCPATDQRGVSRPQGPKCDIGAFELAVPILSIDDNSLDFGTQRVGTTSSSQTATITNTGGADLHITSVLEFGSGDFPVGTDTCPGTVTPGNSCSITVSFHPSATGSRSASLEIASNASSSPDHISLSGFGTAPVVLLSASSLSFGSAPVGTSTTGQTVTVKNTGDADLHVTSLSISGNGSDFPIGTHTCPTTVAPGDSCSISLSFHPTAVGSRAATLAIGSDAASTPDDVALSGTGTQSADLSVTKGASPEPATVGDNLTYTLGVHNGGPTAGDAASLSDHLPGDSSFVSASDGGTYDSGTNTVTWSLGSLANAASVTRTLVVQINSVNNLSNSVSVTSSAFDPDTSNNTALKGSTVVKRSTTLVYDGSIGSDFHDDATFSAKLTDSSASPAANLSGKTVSFTMGSQGCSGTTNASGEASCTVNVNQDSGPQTVVASYAGDATYKLSSDSHPFSIGTEETTLTYNGDTAAINTQAAHLSATLKEDGTTALSAKTVAFTLGSGLSTQTCSGTTDGAGKASCTIDHVNQPTGSQPVKADFAGDADYTSSEGTGSIAVSDKADLSVTKSDSPDPVFVNDNLTYTLGASNAGPTAAQNVVLTDKLPGDTTFVSASGGGTYDSPTNTVTWSLGTVGSAASTSRTLVVKVNSVNNLSNTAKVSSTTPDPDSTNNSATEPTTVNKRVTTLAYDGDTTADYHDTANLGATLTDTTHASQPIIGASVKLTLGSKNCTATTNSSGRAACTVTVSDGPPLTVKADYAGDSTHLHSHDSKPFTVKAEETTLTYTGDTMIPNGGVAHMTATLKEDGTTPVPGETITFTLGSGATAQSCTGVTNASGVASCTISSVSQPLGPVAIKAVLGGDNLYQAASATPSSQAFVFSYSGGGNGTFAVGDLSAASTGPVTFWGSSWSKMNSLSGGTAPSSFKGFSNRTSTVPPACGGTWDTKPGGASGPPATVPTYMAVLVTKQVTKTGSDIFSGAITAIVIVKTNAGYSASGSGTGQVVGTLCHT